MQVQVTQIEDAILRWTHRRIDNLSVEVQPESVILRGQTDSFYMKSLALQGVRELLPNVKLKNAILVH